VGLGVPPAVRVAVLAGALVAVLIVPASAVFAAADDSSQPTAVDEPWFSMSEESGARVVLWFAYSSTCPHCQEAAPWVAGLDDLGWVETRWLQMNGEDQAPAQLAVNLAASIGGEIAGVPTFMYCGRLDVGFDTIETTGAALLHNLEICRDAVLGSGAGVPGGAVAPIADVNPGSDPAIPSSGTGGVDSVADVLAVLVLSVLVVSLIAAPLLAWSDRIRRGPLSVVFLLGVIGSAIAGYLFHVETTGAAAVCPVGDCDLVQQSSYARLFGVIPVGLIGLIGFGVVLTALVVVLLARPVIADWCRVALGVGAVAGVAFSTYLTCVELFVIHAVCAWCLGSAVVAIGVLWTTSGPAAAAWHRLRYPEPGVSVPA